MTSRRHAGFTLVELLVSLAVALIAIALISGAFLAQHRSFQSLETARAAQEAGREALLAIERSLRMAGYGVDPRVAFDFRTYRCPATPCRDAIDKPDELVFVARSSRYHFDAFGANGCPRAAGCFSGEAWPIRAAGPTSLTLEARAGDDFPKGQVFLAICRGASRSTLVTLAATHTALAADGDAVLSLDPGSSSDPYRQNDFVDGCFATGLAVAFKVDRYRWFVDRTAAVPTLMLDRGVDLDRDGFTPIDGDVDDLLVAAKGIDDLQVSYLLDAGVGFTAPDADRNWVVGDTRATVEEPDPTAVAPDYTTASTSAQRFTRHPANIRAVRLSLVSRSLRPDPGPVSGWPGDVLPLNENRSANAAASGRIRRIATRTTVQVRNLDSRALFLF